MDLFLFIAFARMLNKLMKSVINTGILTWVFFDSIIFPFKIPLHLKQKRLRIIFNDIAHLIINGVVHTSVSLSIMAGHNL